ncbi:MAG TPA: hypothetical protein PLZ86_01910 [bacterium]|nr:hypothetical protein [bacterium]
MCVLYAAAAVTAAAAITGAVVGGVQNAKQADAAEDAAAKQEAQMMKQIKEKNAQKTAAKLMNDYQTKRNRMAAMGAATLNTILADQARTDAKNMAMDRAGRGGYGTPAQVSKPARA